MIVKLGGDREAVLHEAGFQSLFGHLGHCTSFAQIKRWASSGICLCVLGHSGAKSSPDFRFSFT